MLVNLAFLGLISSGSVFCALKFGKKYEEILPISCMGLGLILFFFGIAGFLKVGVYAVCILGLALYGLTLFELLKKRKNFKLSVKTFCKNFFTSGFFVYLLIFILLTYKIDGLRPRKWDEFSHWMDIVKVMTLLNDFGTNPESYSMFKSYPPAMTLFQYMLQRVATFLNSGIVFSEWRCFFAYQMYYIAVIMPVFKNNKMKDILNNIILSVIVLLFPLLFFDRVYFATYIDPFLAMLTIAGFSGIILWKKEEKDIFYSIYIWLIIATLILSKDSGMLFAIFVAALYLLDNIFVKQNLKILFTKSFTAKAVVTILAVLLPKMLWKWKLIVTEAPISFDSKVDFSVLVAILTGKEETYRSTVMKNYAYALIEESVTLGNSGIELSYLTVILVSAVLIYGFLRKLYLMKEISEKQVVLYHWIPLAQTIAFTLGMCVIYMFNFSEGEAVSLASFDRYLGTVLMIGGMIAAILAWKVVSLVDLEQRKLQGVILLTVLLFITPINFFVDMLTKENHKKAYNDIGAMDILTEKILEKCDGDDKVYIIAQGDEGFERLVLKYNIRPNIGNSEAWSIGVPDDEDDPYTVSMTAEEWRSLLLEEDYDYVAIYRLNDYFRETYDVLFDDPGYIGLNRVYEVNKETGMLHCEREE